MDKTGMDRLPPEVLNVIFTYIGTEDIKSCRLVCKQWCDSMQLQLNSRIRLNLREDKSKDRTLTLAAKIKSIRFGDFQNVTILKAPSIPFENKFSSLTSLYLVGVTFKSIDEVRRISFQVFGSMTELEFTRVSLSKKAKKEDFLQNACSQVPLSDPVSKVRKLTIARFSSITDLRRGGDIFDSWHLRELFQRFSVTLKQVKFRKALNPVQYDVFGELATASVRLTHLSYESLDEKNELESLKFYIEHHGACLTHIDIDSIVPNIFDRVFESDTSAKCPLKCIRITNQDWTTCKGGNLTNLARIRIGQRTWNSFKFFERVPNLEHVEMPFACGVWNYANQTCPSVHTAILKTYDQPSVGYMARLFPNVSKLIITNTYCRSNLKYPALEGVVNAWPNLVHLEIRGIWDKYLCTGDPDNEISLQAGVENVNLIEYRNLLRLTNLRSFVHNDSESMNVCYGDAAVTQVFLGMSSLRTLRIGRCSMSQAEMVKINEKLLFFTYEIRC